MGRFTDLLEQDKQQTRKYSQQPPRESQATEWDVVGGEDRGGIVVRVGEDQSSDRLDDRLAFGARVREVEVVGNRLHYVKLTGAGPESGWASIVLKDRELLRRRTSTAPIAESDDDGDDCEAPPAGAAKAILPPQVPAPRARGSGARYEVVAQQVAVREAPSLGAPVQFGERRGAVVELHDWDETRGWRLVMDRCERPGWMMLDHPQHGALLRPAGLPFQRNPLDPVGVAAMENDVQHLRKFIDAGADVNVPDAAGHTPLMLAARADHPESVLLLLKAGAGANARTGAGRSAADLAASEPTRALLLALTLRDFDPDRCLEAVGRMRPELLPLAQRQLGVPLRMQQERLERAQAAAHPALPPPAAAPPAAEAGAGERYRVAVKVAVVRADPSLEGRVVSNRRAGDVVSALGRDPTGRWAEVACDWADKGRAEHGTSAWMLIEHDELGVLLEPLGAGLA